MNLKDFIARRENPPETYWSIIIEESQVQSGIWHIEGDTSEVESIGAISVRSDSDDLITAVDTALSSTVQKMPDDFAEPSKTVFGVPSAWVTGGEIKDNYLADIKKICEDLTLTPVGFVVLPEAIAHLYKSDEGVPLSGIVIGLSTTNLEVTVFKLGNLVGSASVARSVSLTEDVIEGLSRFEGATPLPSRFIIYDGKEGELDEAKNELMKATWDDQEKVKFMHTPKAEILSSDRKVLAVCLAGASELSEVSKVAMVAVDNTPDSIPENIEEVENFVPVETPHDIEDLGFVLNGDVTEAKVVEEEVPKVVRPSPVRNFKFTDPKLPKFNFPKINFSVGPMAILVFVIIIGILSAFYFLPKVNIELFVTPKSFEENIDMTFDESNSQILSTSVEGSKTKSATGRKVIGDKAKGTVEIANGNTSPIKLTAGTLLTSSSGLKFALTKEASISGQVLPGSPGTSVLDVSAQDIGSQFNLPKGEIFTVGNYAKSLVAGTSQGDFSGGSSREISAISKDDRDKLSKELRDELIEKANDDLSQNVGESDFLLSGYSSIEIVDETFDHKVGDEADTLKLSLELKVNLISTNRSSLFESTKESLSDNAPSGFSLRQDQIDYKFEFIDEENGKYNFKTAVKANFLPSLDVEKIADEIKGKNIEYAQKVLSSQGGFKKAGITFNSQIFANIKIMPFIKKNIVIEIAAEK